MHRLVVGLARTMAVIGSVVLIALIIMTCVSVVGRILNTLGHSDFLTNNLSFLASFAQKSGPIIGDFEMVEAGVAFAIMAFLPWCQLSRGHAKVDILAQKLPMKLERFLMLCWELVFGIVIVVLAWRLIIGTSDKIRYGETTFLLQFPIWWGYAACAAAAIVAAVVAAYSVWLHAVELIKGTPEELVEGGPGH